MRAAAEMRRRIVLAAAMASALVVPGATAPAPPRLHGNNFFSNCRFSHNGADDPIVWPGKPGRSHPHTFFGNTSTNAHSTLASLRRAGTTCRPRSDTAAYWIPTLFQDGREVRPAKAQVYYVLRGFGQMRAFPAGLRMIAGDAHAVRPQSIRVTFWACGGSAVRTKAVSRVPASCPIIRSRLRVHFRNRSAPTTIRVSTKSWLQLHVDFPDCWDGRRIDSRPPEPHGLQP
jgi:hypothetical protein